MCALTIPEPIGCTGTTSTCAVSIVDNSALSSAEHALSTESGNERVAVGWRLQDRGQHNDERKLMNAMRPAPTARQDHDVALPVKHGEIDLEQVEDADLAQLVSVLLTVLASRGSAAHSPLGPLGSA